MNSISTLYIVKYSIRVLQENGSEMSWAHSFKFEVLYTLAMYGFLKQEAQLQQR